MAMGLETGKDRSYATKMDDAATAAIKSWWEGLTKEELLSYLLDQPTITADNIRSMLANEECKLEFGMAFSTATMNAITAFS